MTASILAFLVFLNDVIHIFSENDWNKYVALSIF